MLIVVSGTHASGKSTLIGDFVARRPDAAALPDPFEFIDEADAEPDAEVYARQLVISARRLEHVWPGLTIAERGPLDFLAYLDALDRLGRPTASASLFRQGVPLTARAMSRVDLLVLLPLDARQPIEVDDEEDPVLRAEMDESLFELADDPDLVGDALVVELSGDRPSRLAQLLAAVDNVG
jgi:hypothetical protein